MLRAGVISFVVFIVLFGIASAVVVYRTGDSRVLSQTVLDSVTSKSTSSAASSSGSLDAAAPSQSEETNTLDTLKEDARKGLLTWSALAMGAGLLCALGWLAMAFSRAKTAATADQFRSSGAAWLACLLGFVTLLVILSFVMLQQASHGGWALSSETSVTMGLMCFGLGLVGYYTSTAVGAPAIMRPSVPFATLIIR